LFRPDGRVVRLDRNAPGHSLELPPDVVGVRSFKPVSLSASLVLTRPDAQTIRRWHVGLDHHLEDEVHFDAPVLYTGERAAVAADGAIYFRKNFRDWVQDRIAGGPFRSVHEVAREPVSLLLVSADGKLSLAQAPTEVGSKEKLTVLPLAGTLAGP